MTTASLPCPVGRPLAWAAAGALALTCAFAQGVEYPRPRPATAGKGRLEYVQGIPVLHLRGTPAEMGTQQGKLLGEQFAVLRKAYLERFIGPGMQAEAAKLAAMGFRQHIPKPYLAELQALSAASGESYVNVLLANTFLDSFRVMACSVVIVRKSATRDGRLLFARNNDFVTCDIAHKASIVTVYHHEGEGRHSFAAIGWPGLIGVLSGMNDAGLCAATLVSLTERGCQPGMPYTMMYRQILEQCTTPREALALIRRTPRTSANNVALAAPGAEPLVVEFTPRQVAARRPVRDVLLATNHFRSPALVAKPHPVFNRYPRLVRHARAGHGQLDVAALKRMLVACQMDGWTMQSMIFEPAERRVHLSVKALPAASGKYEIIDFGRLMAAK